MFKLKCKAPEETYPLHECAVSRCHDVPVVDDDSRRVWTERVPLCERHWAARASEMVPAMVQDTLPGVDP